jgi:small nuclear ribonucleoprotein (snRNP)-like protein
MEEAEKQAGKPAALDLQKLLNTRIVVHVRDGRKLSGTLAQYDEYMNMLLEDVEEIFEGRPANKYKILVVKGGNVQAITI